MSNTWPWPADTTQLDFARRLLQCYRTALMDIDPKSCSKLDEFATTHGHTWVSPAPIIAADDDLIDATEAAAIAGVAVQTIRQWAYRQHIQRHYANGHPTRYRVGDILGYLEETRRKRLKGRTGQSRT